MMSIYLGVDLGHHSIVTASSSETEPFAVTVDANGLSNRSTPSIIGIENNRVIFGEEAETRLSSVPSKIVHSIPAEFASGTSHGPYEVTSGDSDDGELSSIVLESSHLLSLFFSNYIAQVHPGKHLKFVTVSVPVGFGEAQTQAVVDAAHLCGIENFDVIDHMDAAMTLLSKDASSRQAAILVVDCGFSQTSLGFMTDGSIVSKQSIQFGTRNLIELIASEVIVKKPYFLTELKKTDQKFFFRLFKVCEKVLKDLSMLPNTVVDLSDYEESFERHMSPAEVKKLCSKPITINREVFESVLANAQFIKELETALSGIKEYASADRLRVRLEMVGGGSRVPFVARLVGSTFGLDQVGRGMDGSAFAALGAALWSAGKRQWPNSSRVRDEHRTPERRDSLKEAVALQETIQRIHELEVTKLNRKNELEAYLYQVKYWMTDHPKGKDMLNKSVVEPETEAIWSWFYAVEDGVESVSTDGAEYADKLNHIKQIVEKEGSEFFELLDRERRKQEASLTANAEYLASSSAHESAEEKRAKHADNAPVSNEQSIKLAGKNKDEGNELFKHGTITDAMNRYMRAINILAKTNKSTMTSEERAQADAVLLSSNLNMAQCVVKLTSGNDGLSQDERDGLLKRGIACADAALAIDPANPKAKYRKAVCLDRMRETEQAKKVIDDALKQNPDDLDLKGLYDSLVARLKQQHEKSKKFFSKMFQ